MQRVVVSVEENLLAKGARLRNERRVTIKEEPSTSFSDAKIDSLVRTIEITIERINLNERATPRENQPTLQNRNQNPRRNPPQIKQREQWGPDQKIRPPFQENYADEDGEIVEEVEKNQINNLMGVNEDDIFFLTWEEQESFLLTQTALEVEEVDEYKKGFENSIMEVHMKYNLRSKRNLETSSKKNTENSAKKVSEFDPKKNTEDPKKVLYNSGNKTTESPAKRTFYISSKTVKTDVPTTSQQTKPATNVAAEKYDFSNPIKSQTPFSIENELAKLKISIPLTELINKNVYRTQVMKALNIGEKHIMLI